MLHWPCGQLRSLSIKQHQPLPFFIKENYFSCKDCPKGTKIYRQEQCEAHNPGSHVHWSADEPCRLSCLKGNELFSYGRAADGSKCSGDPRLKHVCIQDRCWVRKPASSRTKGMSIFTIFMILFSFDFSRSAVMVSSFLEQSMIDVEFVVVIAHHVQWLRENTLKNGEDGVSDSSRLIN